MPEGAFGNTEKSFCSAGTRPFYSTGKASGFMLPDREPLLPLHHHRHADQRHGGLTAFTTDNGAFDHPGLSLCGFPGNYGEQQSQGQES